MAFIVLASAEDSNISIVSAVTKDLTAKVHAGKLLGALDQLLGLLPVPCVHAQLRSLGIEPADKRIIVMKSAIAWQAAFGDLAQEVLYVDTPGICTANLRSLPYRHVARPIFPLIES